MDNKRDLVNKKNCYTPSASLLEHLNKTLQFEKNKKNKTIAGEELSVEEKREGRNLDRMKVNILDKIIFPSMANLIVFFEYIAKNTELQEIFDDDISDMLFNHGLKGNSINSTERRMAFRRLIESIIKWDRKRDPSNFRYILYHSLQNIIFQNLTRLAEEEVDSTLTRNVILPDLGRAIAWTKYFSKKAEKIYQVEQTNRPALF